MAEIEGDLGIGAGCIGQLERELENVRQERDIPRKAVAIFPRPSK